MASWVSFLFSEKSYEQVLNCELDFKERIKYPIIGFILYGLYAMVIYGPYDMVLYRPYDMVLSRA